MRKILGCLRKADEKFNLISEGDRITVGLSGGKDSMLLLYALRLYQKFSKKEYELNAVCVNLGFSDFNTEIIKGYAQNLGVHLNILNTEIADIVFNIRKEKSPCSLCSKMRKGALYEYAAQSGFNKAAFAHHADDAVQTLLMSMLYESRLNTFSPKSYLSRRNITLIRPLILTRESDIKAAVSRNNIPVAKNPCPVDFTTKREESKEILTSLEDYVPYASDRIFKALLNTDKYNLWNKDFNKI